MGLFGISKKEKELILKIEQQTTKIEQQMEKIEHQESEKRELMAEIEKLKLLSCPEQKMHCELERKIQEEKDNLAKLLANETELKEQIEHLKQLQQ